MKHFISLKNASIEIPIFSSESLSLRKKFLGKGVVVNTVAAIRNLNLQITDGERVGLYGHNGAGKTTLLRCIAGGYYPSSGDLEISGSINSLIDINLGIDQEATGYQNIILKLKMMIIPHTELHKYVQEIIEFSELGNAIYLPVRTYSSGMALRLAFSIVTSIQSDILLLDEWLSVGDESFANKSNTRMRELASKSSILVIASHNLDMLRNNCTRIIYLEHGSILKEEYISK